jgi:hypothetical protein
MTTSARGCLFGSEDTTELRQNSGCSNRVVKELLPQVSLRLGDFEARVRISIGQPRLWKVGIVCGDH